MSADLLTTLAAAGALEAKGGFSIDPDKAREKLRQYQLAEPQRYVLLLVEAAVAGGATRLEFEIDSDDVWLRFDGAEFRHDQLESIYSSLFASIASDVSEQERRSRRALAQLAFAVNSAMALNPRYIEIVSIAPGGAGTRLLLRPDAPDELEQLAADLNRVTALFNSVHVKDRFRPGLLIEFFRSLRGNLIEIQLIRQHCRWSRVPISINGDVISGPIEFEAWSDVVVLDPPEGGRAIGTAALAVPAAVPVEPFVQLLSHGVEIERVPVPGGVHGFMALVDSPRFGKDVSQIKLLRDANFDAVMAAVLAAQAQLIWRLAEACTNDSARFGPPILLEWLALGDAVRPFGSGSGRLRKALAADPCFRAVAEVPLWPLVGGATMTTRALIEADSPIRYTHERFDFAPIDVPWVLALAFDADQARMRALEQLFGGLLVDATDLLQGELARERARLEFLARRHPPELPYEQAVQFPILADIRGELRGGEHVTPIRGQLGIQLIGARRSWMRLIHQGCLLRELPLAHPLPGLCVVVEGPFEPTADYQQVTVKSSFAAVLVAVLETLLAALTEVARSGSISPEHAELRALMRSYIAEVVDPEYAIAFLVEFGFSRALAKRELQRLRPDERGTIRPIWGFDDPSGCHPIATLPIYARVHGGPCSLAQLAAQRARGEKLRWLEAGTGAIPPLDVDVLLLEPIDLASLRALLGADALESFADRLVWMRRRDAFLDRPSAALELRTAPLVRAPLSEPGSLRGELGLLEFGPSKVGDGGCVVDVFYRERRLCEVAVELPLPGLLAWVEGEALAVDEQFAGLADPLELRAPLLAGLVGLIERVLDRAAEQPSALRRCEWWWLLMIPSVVFGFGSGLGAAFVRVLGERGVGSATETLAGLLELLDRYPAGFLDRALGRVRGRGGLPTVEAVLDQLERPSRRPSESERASASFRRALLPAFQRVLELPLVRGYTGARLDASSPRTLTLADLHASVALGEPIAWVGEDFRIDAMPRLDFAIAGLDPIEQRILQAQLGAEALELVGDWLQGRAQFERRRTISAIQVPRGSVLTIVPVAGAGWRGELGIVRDAPRDVQRSKIRLITDQREAAVLDLPAKPVAILGTLSFDALALTDRFDDVTGPERERIRKLVEARIDELLVDFASRYPSLDRADKLRADPIVRHLLATWPPGTGNYTVRAKQQAKLFRMFAELPVFAGARKRWSAAELAEARERGRIKTIAYRDDMALPDGPVVLLDADDVEPTLVALFGPTHDLQAELARARQLAERKAAAPPLPSEAPADALASVAIASEQLRGHLWITRKQVGVLFGRDGRAAERRTISVLCPCAGAIVGEHLSIADDWTRVVLTRSQERMLERAAIGLWTELVDAFAAGAAGPIDPDQKLASTRDAVVELFMRLHAELGRGRLRGGKAKKRKQGNQLEQLYDRLRTLPLLELGNGRFISAEVAERERPIELTALELWSGPSAEELAHQRTIERREAERLRKAELDEQERAEAARRRAEADAREREAARRRAAKREAEAEAPVEPPPPAKPSSGKPKPTKPTKPTPEQLLVEAIREELRLVRADNVGLVSNRVLEALVAGSPVSRGPLFRHAEGRTEIDVGHRLFVAALAGYLDDPALVTMLASAAYSFLNVIHVEIADAHEAEFLRLHASYAGTTLK